MHKRITSQVDKTKCPLAGKCDHCTKILKKFMKAGAERDMYKMQRDMLEKFVRDVAGDAICHHCHHEMCERTRKARDLLCECGLDDALRSAV